MNLNEMKKSIPVRIQSSGYTACPINGSILGPMKSPSSTYKRSRAISGQHTLKLNFSFQTGFKPLEAELKFKDKFKIPIFNLTGENKIAVQIQIFPKHFLGLNTNR